MTYVLIAGETRQEFEDHARAVLAYAHKVTGGTPCRLVDEGGLPDMPSVEIASYEGRSAVSAAWNLRSDPSGYRAARAFALGAMAELGGLDPLTEADAHVFAMDHQHIPVDALASAWHTWAAVRRAWHNERSLT